MHGTPVQPLRTLFCVTMCHNVMARLPLPSPRTENTSCRQAIFCNEVDFKRKSWDGISAEAKDFVAQLLNKDPRQRPSAKKV